MEKDTAQMNDHDLLVTMHEQIKQVRTDIKELKDGTAETLSDHEVRLRRLETWCAIAIGGLYVIEFYLKVIK